MAMIPAVQGNNNVEEILANAGSGLPLIPDAPYSMVIVGSELKDTRTPGGMGIQFTVVITDGQYANTEFTMFVNVKNANEKAVKIGYETLARIAKAVGLAAIPQDSSALHNKKFLASTTTEKGTPYKDAQGVERQGSDRSRIDERSIAPLPAVGVQTTAPAAGADQAATGTQTTVQPGSMPWNATAPAAGTQQ